MLASSAVRMLIQCFPVKVGKSMGIPRKMSRYPVQDHANIMLMKIVDHILKIFRRSITGGRCKISCHLITPGSVKWMLCDSHQFDVGVSHFLNIFCQLCCQFPIIIESILVLLMRMALPGTWMNLINRHGRFCCIPARTLCHPAVIMPGKSTDIRHT